MIKLAVFVLVGYGTKAGLAPMHNWLPDAYSEALRPPAMLSGVSPKVALCFVRFHILTTASGTSFSQTLLLVFGDLDVRRLLPFSCSPI